MADTAILDFTDALKRWGEGRGVQFESKRIQNAVSAFRTLVDGETESLLAGVTRSRTVLQETEAVSTPDLRKTSQPSNPRLAAKQAILNEASGPGVWLPSPESSRSLSQEAADAAVALQRNLARSTARTASLGSRDAVGMEPRVASTLSPDGRVEKQKRDWVLEHYKSFLTVIGGLILLLGGAFFTLRNRAEDRRHEALQRLGRLLPSVALFERMGGPGIDVCQPVSGASTSDLAMAACLLPPRNDELLRARDSLRANPSVTEADLFAVFGVGGANAYRELLYHIDETFTYWDRCVRDEMRACSDSVTARVHDIQLRSLELHDSIAGRLRTGS